MNKGSFPCLELKKSTVGLSELVNHLHQRFEYNAVVKSNISLRQKEFREMAIQLEQDNTLIRQELHSLVAELKDTKERSKILTQRVLEVKSKGISLQNMLEKKTEKIREAKNQVKHKELQAKEIKSENCRTAQRLKQELQAIKVKGEIELKKKLTQQRLQQERKAKKKIQQLEKILVSVPATPSTSMDTLQHYPNVPGMSRLHTVTSEESIPQLQNNLEAVQNIPGQPLKPPEVKKQAFVQDLIAVFERNSQKADVISSLDGAAQFVFNEMENQQKSPCASPLPTILAVSSLPCSPKADEVQTSAVA